jgi:hypothetical protein
MVGPRQGAATACALLALSYVPGWTHVLAIRADRPGAQQVMSREVKAVRAAYVSAMQAVLASVPPSACYAPAFLDTCIDPSGIFLGAARDLWPRVHCLGNESDTVTVEISGCGPAGVGARVAGGTGDGTPAR